MNNLLKKLEDNRTSILLAEIGVWLHLLGKLSEEFIQAQSQQGGSFGYRQLCNNNPLGLETNFYTLITDNWVESLFDPLNNVINNIPGSNVSPENLCKFAEHHLKRHLNRFQNCALLKILAAAHDISGAEEKDLPWQQNDPKQKKKQPDKNNTFCASAYGIEKIIDINNLTHLRNSLANDLAPILENIKNNYSTCNINWWYDNYPEIINSFRNAYRSTVGDTQRPVNDVTLWDAASLAASLFKSALAKMILEGWIEPIHTNNNSTVIQWKILRINVDSLGIMEKGIKVGDILGYGKAINGSLKKCKNIIEIKYCLGNEIYRDNTGIYFSFPDVNASNFWGDLKDELKESIHNIEPELSPFIQLSNSLPDLKDLTAQKNTALKDIVYPMKNEFISSKIVNLWNSVSPNSEVCPICRLRPMKENSDGCKHCLSRRKGRAEEWINDPKHTIWLDEVSDHNDRVALLVCSFSLTDWLNGKLISTLSKKTPSSGRVRRCWETTQEFINSTIFENILNKCSYGPISLHIELRTKRIQFTITPNPNVSRGATCDIDIDGIRLSPVCIDENKGLFITTVNLQILSSKGKTVEEIASWMDGRDIKIKRDDSNKWLKGFRISSVEPAESKFQDYIPYVKIYDFPDQFMVLVPAHDALEIAKKILEQYEIQFSKVRDRLPFHLGIIAFHRRTPLYVVMDAGKRLLESFEEKTKSIKGKVVDYRNIEDEKSVQLEIEANNYASTSFKWKVSYYTNDPQQEDLWHPYIRHSNKNPDRTLSFDYTGNGDFVMHVKEIQQNDQIKIEPSYFTLLYLDNAANRFKVSDDLRPLDDIHRLQKLWGKIEKRLASKTWSLSQIYAFWEDVRKRQVYDVNNFERFVKSDLINILNIGSQKDRQLFEEFLQATKDELLDLCLYWNLQIRKTKSI